jgi:hypothetical protein
MTLVAVLDANVLYSTLTRDLLLYHVQQCGLVGSNRLLRSLRRE